MNEKYFSYNGTTYWFDEKIKCRIEKALEEYKRALEALKSLEDLGIQLPNDSRDHLRLKLAGRYSSYEQKDIYCYITNRMREIERELKIHDMLW